ncbi:tRNA (guanosine(37)-N1)-methyltransferase TrmD [Candidatus Uhrbacteria bacterium]|jgi:tRNA (guanine37-N1)-methyltransferase|nr:tRNA (guanosine(37)-N1)-methyltransferase TrmD [Candidatus Uhrbacteria bacterium]
MNFDIITLFPKTIGAYTSESILGRAQKKKLISIGAHDLRPFSKDKHKKVDDTPYGGGPGMVMTVQPIDAAVRKIRKRRKEVRVILTAASGKQFTQQDAVRLSKYDQLIFICGRYEGIDARVEEHIADESLSIGDYVLTGGELPSMVMTDSIARLVPGVLGEAMSLKEESHSEPGVLEYPQYTKPEEYSMRDGLKKKKLIVPEILLSGNHAKIAEWRQDQSNKRSRH